MMVFRAAPLMAREVMSFYHMPHASIQFLPLHGAFKGRGRRRASVCKLVFPVCTTRLLFLRSVGGVVIIFVPVGRFGVGLLKSS